MLRQERYPDSEYEEIWLYAAKHDKTQAMIEVQEHQKYFGNRVEIVKGRKCPHGVVGVVFYLCRKHFGSNQWFGFDTRIGIKADDGNVYWTSTKNIRLAQ